jgi:hypothetical protein
MELRHRDIVGVALRRMREHLNNAERDEVIADMIKELDTHREAAEHRTEAPTELS